MTGLETKLNQILAEKTNKIIPENIKKDVQMFDVVGTLESDKPDQTKTVTPTTEEQVITPDAGYELASVTVGAVTSDIDSNIQAGNIKKDVSILGVTGTYEGSGGGTVEGIKQFSTIEEMQADPDAKEGDLAVVYRSEIQNATVDSKFQVATFPETVVLDTAITDYVEVRYRAVDSSKMFDCWGNLDSSRFMMSCYTESAEIRIEYTSSDGITYTRTDSTGNPVDFGTEIYYEYAEMWNDAIGKFIQVGGMYFDGLYKCENVKKTNDTLFNGKLVNAGDTEFTDIYIENLNIDYSTILNEIGEPYNQFLLYGTGFITEYEVLDSVDGKLTIRPKVFHKLWRWQNNFQNPAMYLENNKYYFSSYNGGNYGSSAKNYLVTYNNGELTLTMLDNSDFIRSTTNTSYWYYNGVSANDKCILFYENYSSGNNYSAAVLVGSNSIYYSSPDDNFGLFKTYNELNYLLAPTQFNLSNPNELLSGKIVYGKNGAVTGDGSIYDNLNLTELLDKPLNSTGFMDNINARGNIPVLDNKILYYLKFTENGEYSIGNCIQNESDVDYLYKNKNIVVKCYLNYFTVHNGEELIYDFRTEEDYTDAFRITPTTEVNHKITLTLHTGSQDGYNKDRIMQINLETGNVTTLCKRGDLVLEHCDTFSTNNGNSYGYLMDSRYAYLYISKYSSSAPYYVGTRLYLYDTMLDKSAEINFEAPVEQAYSGYGDILPYQTDKALYLKLNSVSHYNLYRMDKSTGELTLSNERSSSYILSDTYSYMAINSLIEDDNYFYYREYGQIKKLSKTTMTVENTLTTNLRGTYKYTLDNKLYYYDNYSTVHVFTINITETELTITEVDTVNVSDTDLDYIKNDCVITKPFSNITSDGSVNIKMYRCAETSINDYDLAVLGYNLGTNNNQKLHILQNNLYTTTISPVEYNTAVDTANEILGEEI